MPTKQFTPAQSSMAQAFGPVAEYYDELMSEVPYLSWIDYVQKLWRLSGIHPKSVLDIACGTGTMARFLTMQGYLVAGVDIAPAMLESARVRAKAAGLSIDFHNQDAAELDLDNRQFDAAISVFDSLNYILDPDRLRMAFARTYNHVKPGGSFLFDLNTEYALTVGMFNQSCTRKSEPLHYRWRSSFDRKTRICRVHMRFTYTNPDGISREFTEVHFQRAYSKDEIIAWLHAAGFTTVEVYDAYSTDPPRKQSDRLFYHALKQT